MQIQPEDIVDGRTMTRVKICDDCEGVMKTIWSDGKTRAHELRCINCGAETGTHQRNLTYIEAPYFDAFETISDDLDYTAWLNLFHTLKFESTAKAFRGADNGYWPQVSLHPDTSGERFTIQARNEPEDGWPFENTDVSWTVDELYLDSTEVGVVNINGGKSVIVLHGVSEILINRRREDGEEVDQAYVSV